MSTALESEIFGDYFSIDSKHIKSYVTKDGLAKALKRLGVDRIRHRPFAVRNSEGRWTAIFPASAMGGNMTMFPGFMKLG